MPLVILYALWVFILPVWIGYVLRSSNIVVIGLFVLNFFGVLIPFIQAYVDDREANKPKPPSEIGDIRTIIANPILINDLKQFSVRDFCTESVRFLEE